MFRFMLLCTALSQHPKKQIAKPTKCMTVVSSRIFDSLRRGNRWVGILLGTEKHNRGVGLGGM